MEHPAKRVRSEEREKGATVASLRDLARFELMRVEAGDDIELVTRRCNEQRLSVWGYPNGKDSDWLRFAKWNSGLITVTVNDPCGGNTNVLVSLDGLFRRCDELFMRFSFYFAGDGPGPA